jgi:chromosome segregation ATPase
MPKVSDTYERAYAACDQLAARGLKPTVKRVAEHIGVNTPALIGPAIKDWLVSSAADRQERLQIPEVPDALVESVSAQWRLAVESARQALAAERAAFEQEKTEIRAALPTLEAAHTALGQEYSAYRQAAEADRQQLQETLGQRNLDLEQSRAEASAATQALSDARETVARLTGALEAAQQEQARRQQDWQTRLDSDHHWHLTRIAEEKERARQDAAEKVTQLESALTVARQQIDTLNGYLDKAARASGELKGENRLLNEAREQLQQQQDALAKQLGEARQKLSESQADIVMRETEAKWLHNELERLLALCACYEAERETKNQAKKKTARIARDRGEQNG